VQHAVHEVVADVRAGRVRHLGGNARGAHRGGHRLDGERGEAGGRAVPRDRLVDRPDPGVVRRAGVVHEADAGVEGDEEVAGAGTAGVRDDGGDEPAVLAPLQLPEVELLDLLPGERDHRALTRCA
jgi:hypothetical protein